MADQKFQQPVRTGITGQDFGDFAVHLVDKDIPTQKAKIDADGNQYAVVSATDLDIRDLSAATDSVEAKQATRANLNGNMTIQIAGVDAANGNPVPVSDAGGSITVDASNLDIRDLVFASDKVDVSGSSVTVSATDLDIRDLSAASDSVKAYMNDEAGNPFSNANPLPVSAVEVAYAGEVDDYDVEVDLAADADDTHEYLTTAAFKLTQVEASGSGAIKIQVLVETAALSGIYTTKFVKFSSPSDPNINLTLERHLSVPTGCRIQVIRTNEDGDEQNVYSTISGYYP